MNLSKIFIFWLVFFLVVGIGASAPSQTEKRYIILYKEQVTGLDIIDLHHTGAKIKHRYSIIPAVTVKLDENTLSAVRLHKNVKAVFEDTRVYAFLSDSVPQIKADQVHSAGVTGFGVKVCIVDTGIEDSHPYVPSLVAWKDFINNQANPYDDNGHGTHVAGIVASTDPTYRGVAYGSSLMGAKVLDSTGSGWASDVIAGIDWCVQNGADIISMSLGGGAYTSTCDSEAMAQAANNAVNQGVVVLAASGNDGYINAISTPACGSKVIAVGAVDKNDGRTPYSNEGKELDVVAPGTGITSTVPTGSCELCNPSGFKSLTGTSMATPHASGTAALVLEANNLLTPQQVRTILRSTAKDLGVKGFDTIYGYGRVDAYEAYQYTITPHAQVFFDDFQSGFGKWTESNEFDWNIEGPAERNILGYPSSNLVTHADACTSSTGCILTMKNSIDLSGYQSATLKFWRYVDNDLDLGEFLKVEIFDGTSWNQIFYWTNGQGDDDAWHYETVNLSNYLVNNFNLRFISKESSSYEDTEIDDVFIEVPVSSPPPTTTTTTTTTTSTTTTTTSTTTTSTTTTTLPPVNQPPVANAGSDQTVTDSDGNGVEAATLNGSASYDPDGTIVSYEWKEGLTVLGTSATITVNFTVGVHNVTLEVVDNNGASDTDNVIITVNEGPPPTTTTTTTTTSTTTTTTTLPPGPTQIFSDDFQSGFNQWIESNEFDWNIESPAERNIPGYPSSNLVAHADNCDSFCVLTMTNPVDLSSYNSATLKFWRYLDRSLDSGEFLKVEIYDGTAWNQIFYWTHNSGDDDTWHYETYSLPSQYLVNNFNLRFTSKESGSLEETEVDDVLITGSPV